MLKTHFLFLCLTLSTFLFSQENDINNSQLLKPNLVETKNPLRAGLYSSVLPGLGQYYNEQYWKVPVVLGIIGTGIGFTLYLDDQHQKYRSAYIAELNNEAHEFSDIPGITAAILGAEQDDKKRNRDYAIAITALLYILNVVDATVDAHLYDIRRDRDLSIEPVALNNPYTMDKSLGVALKLKF